MLRADGDMPLSYDRFLEMCKVTVSESNYKVLKELTLLKGDGPLFSQWLKFYGVFHAELTYQRNLRLGRTAVLPGERNEEITKLILSAMSNKNPLLAEEMLLAFQFLKLDEMVGTHYFDDHALMGYALKLKLLERKKSFDAECGKAEFDRITGKLEQEIMNM